tara:strand:- start:483 stop:668 length:186 start_codon:yes stop_codon:yes gene_type:complete
MIQGPEQQQFKPVAYKFEEIGQHLESMKKKPTSKTRKTASPKKKRSASLSPSKSRSKSPSS